MKRHRFDPNVIIRAHRFRAEMAGYRLVRGHFMDGESDRADRWYPVPSDAKPEDEAAHRQSDGYRSVAEAADAAIIRNGA